MSEEQERTDLEKQVDAELIAKGPDVVDDFDEIQAIFIPAKKRGRPSKKTATQIREFYCATCREVVSELNAMKIGAGDERFAIFCPNCQKSLGFIHPDLDEKVANLIKNNPTK